MPSDERHNKGHYIPTKKEEFERYVDTISTFILKGGSKLSTFSDWRTHACTLYANKHFRSATLIEKFVSQAFRLYHVALSEEEKGVSPTTAIRHGNDVKQLEAWEKFYLPLYLAIAHTEALKADRNKLHAEIERLKQGVLTDEVIDRALTKQLPLFMDYLKESEIIPMALPMAVSDVSNFLTPELRDVYRSLIMSSGVDDVVLFLLSALYMANPDLLSQSPPIDQKTMEEARESLFKAVAEEGEKIRSVWKQVLQKHPEAVEKRAAKKFISNWRQ